MKQKPDKEEIYCIKTGFNKRFTRDEDVPLIKEYIENLVINVSKITHRGSLIFNSYVLHCLKKNIQIPKIDLTLISQCFTIGTTDLRKRNEILEKVYEKYEDFPLPERMVGDTQSITYTSKKYLTNFSNHLILNFERFQKRFINGIIKEFDLEKSQFSIIKKYLNNWERNTEPNDEIVDFLEPYKEILGDDPISSYWLNKNQDKILKFYYEILQFLRGGEAKCFTLAPISRIKRHFIAFDTGSIFKILKGLGLIPKITLREFTEDREYYYNKYFRFHKNFDYYFETDGVSLTQKCIRTKVTKTEYKQNQKNDNVFGIDPGRVTLICASNGEETYNLSRREYYFKSGMTKANKNSKKWNSKLQEPLEDLSTYSPKGKKFMNYVYTIILHYDILWEEYSKKRWSQQRFRIYIQKNKTLDRFFNQLGDCHVAYGGAKYNPNAKNEISAPTSYLFKKCSQHHSTTLVDEFNTSKKCYHCRENLDTFYEIVEGDKIRQVRGLRWCGSTSCRKLLNRDVNASMNIREAYLSKERPPYLSRNIGSTTQRSIRKIRLRSSDLAI